MQIPELKGFALVGGTALSLKYGHRKSVDLDLFLHEKFDIYSIVKALEKEFGVDVRYEQQKLQWAVFCIINKIKVDIVYYPHNLIAPIEIYDGIRMYNTKDIAAMKINAILGRGVKKDFWDLFELLNHYRLDEILEFHKLKFPSQMLLISIPNAITYFVDAEESEAPISLKDQTWEAVKKSLQSVVREYLR